SRPRRKETETQPTARVPVARKRRPNPPRASPSQGNGDPTHRARRPNPPRASSSHRTRPTPLRPQTASSGVQVLHLPRLHVQPPVVAVPGGAGAVARVADATLPRADAVEQRVLLAVDQHLDERERLARGLALLPELVARRAPEDRRPGRDGRLQRQL